MLDQRRRRWADVVQILKKYFEFAVIVGHRWKPWSSMKEI